MSTSQHQAVLDPAATIDGLLQQTRLQLESFLSGMPRNHHEARRAITRAFSYEPTPEALQNILEIAERINRSARPDPQAPLCLQILTARILAQGALKSLLESDRLDVFAITSAAGLLTALLPVGRENETLLRSAMEAAEPEGRGFLRRVGDHLGLPARAANAALALAPALQTLARSDDLAGAERTLLNALALHTMIREHLDAWSALARVGGEDSSLMAVREGLFVQLGRDRDTYDYFSERFRDEPSAGGELRKVQCDLADTDQVLRSVLDTGATDGLGEPVRRAKVSKAAQEEILQCARAELKSQAESEDRPPGPRDNREPRRIKLLVSVAGVLLMVAIPVNILSWREASPPSSISPSEFSAPLGLQAVTDLGPVLYSKAQGSSWSALSVTEKRAGLAELGRQASGRGFEMVILVDERGRELAAWSMAGGTKLLETGR